MVEGGIVPAAEVGSYLLNFYPLDGDDPDYSTVCIEIYKSVNGDLRKRIDWIGPRDSLSLALESGEWESYLRYEEIIGVIKPHLGKVLHILDRFPEYMSGPPYPNYEDL